MRTTRAYTHALQRSMYKWEVKKGIKIRILEIIFCAKQELITRTYFAYNTLRLVRISFFFIRCNESRVCLTLRKFLSHSLLLKLNSKPFFLRLHSP